jgi:hypothetical protein
MASPSWLDTAEGAVRTLGPSSLEQIKDIARGVMQTVTHPVESAKAYGKIASGIASKAAPYLGSEAIVGQQSPQKKAQREAVADAAWANIADKYSKIDPSTGERHFDVDTLKNTLATNPGGILGDLSIILPGLGEAGVAGRAGKVIGALGDVTGAGGATGAALKAIGSGAQNVGKAISASQKYVNPLTAIPAAAGKIPLVRNLASGVGSTIASTPSRWQQLASHVPEKFLSDTYLAGKAGSTPLTAGSAETAGDVFKHFATNDGTAEIQQTAARAINKAQQKASNAYVQGKAGLSTAPVDYQPVLDALNKSEQDLGKGSSLGFTEAKKAISGDPTDPKSPPGVRQLVEDVFTNPDPLSQNIENADALKRQIWDMKQSTSNSVAQQHLGNIYNAVKDAISTTDPDYAKLMDSYQAGRQNIQDLSKTLGVNDRTANTAALAKQLRQAGKPAGVDLLNQLAEEEPALPFMLAGHAARTALPGHFNKLMDAGLLYGTLHGGLPSSLGEGAAQIGALATAAMSSPSVALNTNYRLGQAANIVGNIANKVPAPIAAAGRLGINVAKGVTPSTETGTALAGQFAREEDVRPRENEEVGNTPKFFTGSEAPSVPDSDKTPEDDGSQGWNSADVFGTPETDDTRPQRASGGAVKDIEHLVEALMKRAHHEKKHATKETEHFLKLPDTTVAKALAITKKAIA